MPPAPPTPTPRLFYGWIILPACFLITLVASGTRMAFGVFITPLVDAMGWSHSAVSFTYALGSIVTGVGVLAVGSFLHSQSLRRLLLLGGILHGIGVYMTSTVITLEGFYFWYGFIASLGRSVFFISTATLMTRWFASRRGLVMGLTMSGNGLGPFLFSPLVTWLIFRWDWQTAFAAIAIAMTACIVLSCLFIRNHPNDMGLEPYGADPTPPTPKPTTPPASGSSRSPQAHASNSVLALWRDILRQQGFWTLGFINFFCCVCHSIPLVHVVGFAQNAGLSAFASAWVLALMSLSSITGRIFWGIFADRHTPRFALMMTLFIQGALVLWLVNTQDPVIFFLYAVIWGFGYGGVGTQYGVVARELYGPRLFGPGYAGQGSFAMVGMATGGFLGGYLFDLSGSYTAAWLISFGAGLISSLLAMDLLSQDKRAQVEPELPASRPSRPTQAVDA